VTAPTVRLVNVANLLTTIRLVLVPVFLVALFFGDGHQLRWRIAAFVIFAVAMVTDRLDGALARSYGMVTEFGKLADPIADKALLGAALIGLSVLGDLAWWVTVLILVREIGITILRFAVLRRGVIPASRGGKLKTLVQAVAIGLFILPLTGVWHSVATVVMAGAIVLTVVTGIDYVVQAGRDTRGRPAGH
jgi:CDP-diacylglycerol---glycerol-3-phosphate 3-phosphatidyltransferase